LETSFHTLTFGPASISTHNGNLTSIGIIDEPNYIYYGLEADKKSDQHKSIVDKCLPILEGANNKIDIPLLLIGSDFQKKAWQAVSKIPYGKTASYTDIANTIDVPKSYRAIGSACAANPIAVIIPCHRVITKNGKIGEYKWGTELKRKFLAREQLKK
jgi:O-6-methylguanine DNA methyltransferase